MDTREKVIEWMQETDFVDYYDVVGNNSEIYLAHVTIESGLAYDVCTEHFKFEDNINCTPINGYLVIQINE